MANTSNTSGISLSRSILLLHTLSNRWYVHFAFLEVFQKLVVFHGFQDTLPLTGALSWLVRQDARQTLPRQRLGQHWGLVRCLGLPGAYLSSSSYLLLLPPPQTIWSSWRLPAIFSPQIVLKLRLNLRLKPWLEIKLKLGFKFRLKPWLELILPKVLGWERDFRQF